VLVTTHNKGTTTTKVSERKERGQALSIVASSTGRTGSNGTMTIIIMTLVGCVYNGVVVVVGDGGVA